MANDVHDLSSLSDGALVYLVESHKKAYIRSSDLVQEYKDKAADSYRKFAEYKAEVSKRGLLENQNAAD